MTTVIHDDPKLVAEARAQTPGQLRVRIGVLTDALRDMSESSAAFWRMQQQTAALERVLAEKDAAR